MQVLLAPLLVAFALIAPAVANDYDEAVDGDISNNRNNPTSFPLDEGVNHLTASQRGGTSGAAVDRDYLTVVIPPGLALQELRLVAYSHATELAFMGFQKGSIFVGSSFSTTPGDLLGGHIYGLPDLGQDVLPALALLPGVQGFPVPLPSGSYTFWFNQGGDLTTASFEFDLVRDTVGHGYCSVPPNSTGETSVLFGSGSGLLAANDLTLVARDLPPAVTVVGLASRSTGFVPNPGGSLGNLCVGGSIGRFPGAFQADASGVLQMAVDWQAMPQPNGYVLAAPGETWHFQLWHREVGGASHFTPGWTVQVQ